AAAADGGADSRTRVRPKNRTFARIIPFLPASSRICPHNRSFVRNISRLSASPRTNPQNRRSAGFLHAFLSQNLKGPPQESDTLLTGQAPIIEALLSRGGG